MATTEEVVTYEVDLDYKAGLSGADVDGGEDQPYGFVLNRITKQRKTSTNGRRLYASEEPEVKEQLATFTPTQLVAVLESGARLLGYAAVDHNTILRQQGQED